MSLAFPVRAAVAAVLLVQVLAPRPCRADDNAEARVLFERGNRRLAEALVARGEGRTRLLEDALDAYVESLLLVRSRNAVFNAGVTLEALGRKAEAFAYFREYVDIPDLEPGERDEGRRRLDALRRDVAVVSVDSDPAGAAVRVDRRDLAPVAVTPAEFAVTEGAHELFLELDGCEPRSIPVTATVGGTATVVVSLDPVAAPEPPAPPPPARFILHSDVPAQVRLGDRALGDDTRIVDTPMAPGTYDLRVEAEGYVSAALEIALEADATLTLEASLAEDVGDQRRLGAWPPATALAAGVVGAAALGTSIWAVIERNRYERDPNEDRLRRGPRIVDAATGLWVTTIAFGVTALVLYLVDGPVDQPRSSIRAFEATEGGDD